MSRFLSVLALCLIVVSACSSESSDDTTPVTAARTETSVTQTEATAADTTEALDEPSGTLISAADGGVVTFGDVTLTVPPGALVEDTEIQVSALAESEWPEGLAVSENLSVLGDIVRLSPDGLEFLEPAVLSRPAGDVAGVGGGDVSVGSVVALSGSGGQWTSTGTSVAVFGGSARVESSIDHFSDNAVVFRDWTADAMATATLNPVVAERKVGDHFIAWLAVDAQLGQLSDPWEARFRVDSGPLVLGMPSGYSTGEPGSGSLDHRVVPPRTPVPARLPAAYNCADEGEADFSVNFSVQVLGVQSFGDAVVQNFPGFDADHFAAESMTLYGDLAGIADCFDEEQDLIPGLMDITSGVRSDPADHSCCVPRVPRKARMTLGSLWFMDSKLGDDTSWQGLFFDRVAGSSDDVMPPGFDAAANPPNTVEVVLADDFDETGRFTVEGVGSVAGFSNVRVRLEAVATDTHNWSGTLTKGVDGRLPTGQAIIYDISGSLIAPRPIAFVDDVARAFRVGDSQFLLDHLHPELLSLYGGACVEFAEGLSSPDLDIVVHSFVDVFDWDLSLDGHDMVIENAVRLDVTRTENGIANRTLMHIAPRPVDGLPTQMTWFADCGDALLTEAASG